MKKMNFDSKDTTIENFDTWEMKGKLETNPDYQRDFVYTEDKSSRLIESAIMCIPLPTIYLCEEEGGKYSIIDGQQRIVSFIRFRRGLFCLKGLTELTSLNGKFYKDLDEETQTLIDDTTIRTIIIRKESASAKYDIFERLNRGAVTLKEQELRNCVYRGRYNTMINELALNNKNVELMFISKNSRMNYQENILRVMALRDYLKYTPSMKTFLNKYMKIHQFDDESSVEKDREFFVRTLSTVIQVLGVEAFKTVDYDKKILLNKFSSTFYDAIMIPFSMFDKNKLILKKDLIKKEIDNLKFYDDKFHLACYAATGSRERVITRIHMIYNLLFTILGSEGIVAESRAFNPEWKEPLAKKQKYICPLCKNKIETLEECEIDHIIPFSKGGLTIYENAQLVHKICNRHKSNSFIQELDEIISEPQEGQVVVSLEDEKDLSFTKPDYLIYKNYRKSTGDYYSLAVAFFDLLRELDPDKLVELANGPYKLSTRSKAYIERNVENMNCPYEVIPGVYCETLYSSNRLFQVMKDLAIKFGLDLKETKFTLKLDEN